MSTTRSAGNVPPRARATLRLRVAAVALLAASSGCAGSAPRLGDHAVPRLHNRIHAVESGLLPAGGDSTAPAASLAERMRHYAVPGVSVAVIEGGRIAWARGYGVLEAGGTARVDTGTRFQAASISKPVTTIAALRLVEQGRLTLDEDVNLRLVSWRIPASEHTAGAKVTLRQLFTHSAGLSVSGFVGYVPGQPVPSLLQVLQGAPPANSDPVRADTVPGSAQRYSGGGFTVAQLLVAEAAGVPFDAAMRDLVLAPTGMARSTFTQPLPVAFQGFAASGHDESGARIDGRWRVHPEQAAAGLWTTPSDLARLVISVQRAAAGASGEVLSPALAREMITPQRGPSGLGFVVRGDPGRRIFRHAGSNVGFRAQLVAFAEGGRGAVVMTNGNGGAALSDEIMASIARAYRWPADAQGNPR